MKSAIIGCGGIAQTHADVLKTLGHEIIAICDKDEDKANKLKNDFNLDCAVYTDYKEMLNEVRPDVVHICTPHFLHAEMSICALEKDINVICEKPVCISEEQYYALREAEKNSKAIMGVSFQNRYLETNNTLKVIAEREGGISVFGAVPWKRDEQYYLSTDWRGRKPREGGGVMMNQAIHTLDLTLWLLGEPKAITGSVDNYHLKEVIDEEDIAQFKIEFENGATACFYATTANSTNIPVIISLTTNKDNYTTLGKAVYNGNNEVVAVNLSDKVNAKDYWGNGHKYFIKDFYEHAKEGMHFHIDVKESFKAVKTILELYKSNGKRREFSFKEL